MRLLFFIFLIGCTPFSQEYRDFYSYTKVPIQKEFTPSQYLLVILVDAPHLDYTDCHSLLKTIVKHPSNGSKNRDVGHAWIYLEGFCNGERVFIEGGHSGELGIRKPKYFDGVMNYLEYGTVYPSEAPCYEPNPIKYLWEDLDDGFFQAGSGGHVPTFAAKINLSREQFDKILNYIINIYPFEKYGLTSYQCSTFVAQVAALADFHIDSEVNINIEKQIYFNRAQMILWNDSEFDSLTLCTPDAIEESLYLAVADGRAEYALAWYHSLRKNYPRFLF